MIHHYGTDFHNDILTHQFCSVCGLEETTGDSGYSSEPNLLYLKEEATSYYICNDDRKLMHYRTEIRKHG